MNSKNYINIIALTFLIWSCNNNKEQSNQAKSDPRISHVDSVLTQLNNERGFNGNVLIAEQGKISYSKSFGFADYQKRVKLTENTIFNIASISKTFTAVGIMILVEQGKLALDNNVIDVLDNFPYPEVTVQQLLSHTSGIIVEQRPPFLNEIKDKGYDNQKVYELFSEIKPELVFPSGTNYMYSNSNYIFLALIIEKLSGESYASFLKDNIFKPAQMNRSFLHYNDIPEDLLESVAKPHQSSFLSKDPFPVSHEDSTFINMYGEGWIYSTTKDLFQYHKALQDGKILSKKTLEEMYTPISLKNDKTYEINGKTNYPSLSGLAWRVAKDSISGKIVYHSGGVLGGRTMLFRNVSKDMFYVCLTNNDESARNTFSFPFKKLHNEDYKLDKLYLSKEFGKIYLEKGVDVAIDFFEEHKSDKNYVPFSGWDYEDIGIELIAKKDLKSAIKLYELYNSEYPKVSFGHKNLGKIYNLMEDKNQSIKHYKLALEYSDDEDEKKEIKSALGSS